MPTLTELLKPTAEQEGGEATDGKAEIDPVGRDLMNALLANFHPRFKEETPPPKEE